MDSQGKLEAFAHAYVLAGPTASGKTTLGLELAGRMNAEIVSMDSMTLYRGMDIGTAKPDQEVQNRVRHHLIDVLDPWESGGVAWWLAKAAECCREIEVRGKRVLFVGGTPLYLKALLRGLFDGPPADVELRRRLTEESIRDGEPALHRRLAQSDPITASRVHPHDVRRIIRALEVWELTGSPMSAWQQQWTNPPQNSMPRCLWLDVPREELYQRINARVREMVNKGWVEEARALLRLPKPLSKEASQALGYAEIFEYLQGRADLEETIERVQIRTRHFAKRQITWFRHLPECRPATPDLTFKLWDLTMNSEDNRIQG
jgi:tRNA dimethylallyltransferase